MCACVCVCVCVCGRARVWYQEPADRVVGSKELPTKYKTYTPFLIKYDIYTERMVRKITRLGEPGGLTKLHHLDADYGFLSCGPFKSIIGHSLWT